ncbi:MAG TPA: ABC transporter permease [Bacteroidia bacterium]|nr:ABC transporter permease [Bacteroidia bacterium]
MIHILLASVLKEVRLLIRDRVGLALMFLMPVVLVVVITSVQNSAFNIVNDNKISLLLCNEDTGSVSKEFIAAIGKLEMFNIVEIKNNPVPGEISKMMKEQDAMVALIIPGNFSPQLSLKANSTSAKALTDFGLGTDSVKTKPVTISPDLIFHPVLQESYCRSISGALQGALLLIENKLIIQSLYKAVNEKEMPFDFEKEMTGNKTSFKESYALINGSRNIPNATQHNVPAWTVFAMFFTVISLGGNVVKEKLSGSFTRLKTLPANYLISLAAKQFVYTGVILLQVLLIFSIGVLVFPKINLPGLNIPGNIFSLVLVTLLCGWCAISYAMCIGVFAQTQEQCNGFGAVSVVLLAAIGGIFVPSFAMPQSFKLIMNISPLHWCIESYYGLFLQGAKLKDIINNIFALLITTFILQLLALTALKRKNLI